VSRTNTVPHSVGAPEVWGAQGRRVLTGGLAQIIAALAGAGPHRDTGATD